MPQLDAPWTDAQVTALNEYQNAGYVHPFTHGDGEDQVDLIATRDGWVREAGGPVVQTWAHDFMADGSWRSPVFEALKTVRVMAAFLVYADGDYNPAERLVGIARSKEGARALIEGYRISNPACKELPVSEGTRDALGSAFPPQFLVEEIEVA